MKQLLSLLVILALLLSIENYSVSANFINPLKNSNEHINKTTENTYNNSKYNMFENKIDDDTIHSKNYEYTLLDDGTVKIDKYIGNENEVIIPDSINGNTVTVLSNKAFKNNRYLEKVTIPKTVIGVEIELLTLEYNTNSDNDFNTTYTPITVQGASPFIGCTYLKEINVASGNKVYKSIDGVLFTTSSDFAYTGAWKEEPMSYGELILLQYPSNKDGNLYEVPNSVKYIGSQLELYNDNSSYLSGNAFSYCKKLTTVSIPSTVQAIKSFEFEGSNLTIYGESGSYAEKYANDYSIMFKDINLSAIIGDVDFDEKITSNDALNILRRSVSLETFDEYQSKIGDIDNDGKINSSDSLAVLRYSVGFRDVGNTIGTEINLKINLTAL